jgi:hypothetical protein
MKLQKRPVTAKQENSFKDKVFFWKGIPVCLTKQLAEFYECSTKNLLDNFNYQKDKFRVRTHYFKLGQSQILEFNNRLEIPVCANNVTVLYLWTQKGAARHAKMLTTDKAWEVWEELETSYFEKNTKTQWERVGDVVTPKMIHQQQSISHQKSNSNEINAENVYSGDTLRLGRVEAMQYNQRNCMALTRRLPSDWRQEGRQLGLPRVITRSAKAVARVVAPEIACARSMADRLVLDGIDEPVAFEVAESCVNTFRLLDQCGWRPKEFQN